MRFPVIACFLLFSSVAALAQSGSNETEMRAREVGRSLRCVVCQNQSIDESDAPLAADMRRLVRKQIDSGMSNEEVIDFMRAQYGDYVLLKPPVQGNTLVLWLAPAGLVLLAMGRLVINSRRRIAPDVRELSAAESERVKSALETDAS